MGGRLPHSLVDEASLLGSFPPGLAVHALTDELQLGQEELNGQLPVESVLRFQQARQRVVEGSLSPDDVAQRQTRHRVTPPAPPGSPTRFRRAKRRRQVKSVLPRF